MLARYTQPEETGQLGGFIPTLCVTLGVNIPAQIFQNKKNVIATIWQREMYFQQPSNAAALNAMASERVEKLLQEFIEKYQAANPGKFPIIYMWNGTYLP